MSVIKVGTPFNIDFEFAVAPFHKRVLAWLIDLVIIYLYIILAERYLVTPLRLFKNLGTVVTILLVALPAYCYHLVFEVFADGQSPGKMVLRIQVVSRSGKVPDVSQYLLRWSFRLVDMVLTLGAGAVLSAALTKHNQRIGDLVAGTVVIDQHAQTRLTETIYLEIPNEAYQPVYKEVMQLSDRDINGINNLLDDKRRGRDADLYVEQVVQRICEVLQIERKHAPREFLRQLLRDYNYLTRK